MKVFILRIFGPRKKFFRISHEHYLRFFQSSPVQILHPFLNFSIIRKLNSRDKNYFLLLRISILVVVSICTLQSSLVQFNSIGHPFFIHSSQLFLCLFFPFTHIVLLYFIYTSAYTLLYSVTDHINPVLHSFVWTTGDPRIESVHNNKQHNSPVSSYPSVKPTHSVTCELLTLGFWSSLHCVCT